jgi:magnesium chelatase subunit D
MTGPDPRWSDAAVAAALFAIDPTGTGVVLRARAGAARERWLDLLRELLPTDAPMRLVPLHVADDRLLGGLDLGATLQAGRPVALRGLLSEADGGVVRLAMAERLTPGMAARICAVLDAGEVVTMRDGLSFSGAARFGVVALDEGVDDEQAPAALTDRLAFHLWLDDVRPEDHRLFDADDIVCARERLASVEMNDDAVHALCTASAAFGIASVRVPLLALRAARAAAALDGRATVNDDDIALAARLVLAPRATVLPASDDEESIDATEPPPPSDGNAADDERSSDPQTLDDVVLNAVRAAIPAGLLSDLRLAQAGRPRRRSSGKAGVVQKSQRHGRPTGARRGDLGRGARLNVIETLRAAAPWQPLRARDAQHGRAPRIQIRREDFRIARFKQRSETVAIFVVDASGSSALHRLAEAKGAVELLLADCYVRRDQVALLAFRGTRAELLLPPTRSLARAKRSLAALPGGGGTPLAAALDAAAALADGIRRKGQTPVVITLTDGRANIARDGNAGRERAHADAVESARVLRAAGFTALLLDTSPHPQPAAATIASEMGARYLPLPHADAARLSQAVRGAMT